MGEAALREIHKVNIVLLIHIKNEKNIKKKNFVFTPGSGPLLRLHNKAIPRDEPYGTCAYFSSRYDLACEPLACMRVQ